MMKQVVLHSYAIGNPRFEDFAIEAVPVPQHRDNEVLLRTLWLSLDPSYAFAIDENYLTGCTHTNIGDVLYGGTVSEVVDSHHPEFNAGEYVGGRTVWREMPPCPQTTCHCAGLTLQ